jgi:hypothetical protein
VLNVGKYSLALSLTDDPPQAFDAFKTEEASGWVDWLAVGVEFGWTGGFDYKCRELREFGSFREFAVFFLDAGAGEYFEEEVAGGGVQALSRN